MTTPIRFRHGSFALVIAAAAFAIHPATLRAEPMRVAVADPAAVPTPFSGISPEAGGGAAPSGRNELSVFNQLAAAAGVRPPEGRYTVFAPVNDAFAAYPQEEFSGLYTPGDPGAAEIVRNHIVPREVHLSDTRKGQNAAFAVNGRIIRLHKDKQDEYVDGHRVIDRTLTRYGMLYHIDGVIANGPELTEVRTPRIIAGGAAPAPAFSLSVPENAEVHIETRSPYTGETLSTTTVTTPSQ